MGSKQDKELEGWDWPQNRWLKVEYACPHGVGHGYDIHGCDGCCAHISFKKCTKRPVKFKRALNHSDKKYGKTYEGLGENNDRD